MKCIIRHVLCSLVFINLLLIPSQGNALNFYTDPALLRKVGSNKTEIKQNLTNLIPNNYLSYYNESRYSMMRAQASAGDASIDAILAGSISLGNPQPNIVTVSIEARGNIHGTPACPYYAVGAYAGLEISTVLSPSSRGYDPFWGKDVDNMPVELKHTVVDSLVVSGNGNTDLSAYFSDYQFGKGEYAKQNYEPAWAVKPNGGGSNSLLSHQMPSSYRFSTDKADIEMSSMGRTDALCTGGATRSNSYVFQLGDIETLYAEADFMASTRDASLPTEFNFNAKMTHTFEMNYIAPKKVELKVVPGMSNIIQQGDLVCRHASEAMIGKYWVEKYAKEMGVSIAMPTDDLSLMQLFKSTDHATATDDKVKYMAYQLNIFFDQYINPKIEQKLGSKLVATPKGVQDFSYNAYIKEIDNGNPVIVIGSIEGAKDKVTGQILKGFHAGVAYGYIQNKLNGDLDWVAINDTWGDTTKVRYGDDRLWIQEDGKIKESYGYDEVAWWPVPDVGNDGLTVDRRGYWKWNWFITSKPIGITISLVDLKLNDTDSLDYIAPIKNTNGTVEIAPAPAPLGGGNMLHLVTPDGAPVGVAVDTILPEDFEIEFEYAYAGIDAGVFQILLDDAKIDELALDAQTLDKLFAYDKKFNSTALGLEAYRLRKLTFQLKSEGDPEMYLANLTVRNLNAVVTPEPTSVLLFGLGGGVLALFRRKKA